MPYRESLHTMINMLSDFGVFEERRVTIEVVNGVDIRWAYDPPLSEPIIRELTFVEAVKIPRDRLS